MEDKNLREVTTTGDRKELQKYLMGKVTLEEKVAALKELCLLGLAEVVPVLLENTEIDLNQRDDQGHTLLSIACSGGYSKVAQELLNSGAQVDL